LLQRLTDEGHAAQKGIHRLLQAGSIQGDDLLQLGFGVITIVNDVLTCHA
jgi:hypothetical protein